MIERTRRTEAKKREKDSKFPRGCKGGRWRVMASVHEENGAYPEGIAALARRIPEG